MKLFLVLTTVLTRGSEREQKLVKLVEGLGQCCGLQGAKESRATSESLSCDTRRQLGDMKLFHSLFYSYEDEDEDNENSEPLARAQTHSYLLLHSTTSNSLAGG